MESNAVRTDIVLNSKLVETNLKIFDELALEAAGGVRDARGVTGAGKHKPW